MKMKFLSGIAIAGIFLFSANVLAQQSGNYDYKDVFKESFYTTLSKQFLHLVVKNQKTIEIFSKVFDILNIEETFLDIVKKIITWRIILWTMKNCKF